MQWTRSKAVNVCNFNEKHMYLLQQTTEESLLQSCSEKQVKVKNQHIFQLVPSV